MKVAFIGLPSSGKTTLSKQVAEYLNASYIPEMARFYIKNIGRPLQSGDQYIIAKLQSDLEKELENPKGITICDVPVYASAVYDKVYNKGENINEILALSAEHKYDIVFNIVDTLPYVEDGVRYNTPDDMFKIESMIDLYNRPQKIINIVGVGRTDRFNQVLEKLL